MSRKVNQFGTKKIAKKLEFVERVECLAKNPTFITLKDHKEKF